MGEFGDLAELVLELPALEGLKSKAGRALTDIRLGLERMEVRLLLGVSRVDDILMLSSAD